VRNARRTGISGLGGVTPTIHWMTLRRVFSAGLLPSANATTLARRLTDEYRDRFGQAFAFEHSGLLSDCFCNLLFGLLFWSNICCPEPLAVISPSSYGERWNLAELSCAKLGKQ